MRPAPRRPGNSCDLVGDAGPGRVDQPERPAARARSAYSVSRTIFSTVRAPHDPAFTVGSLAITHTGRPSMRPTPVTTPSAGRSAADALASSASSANEPGSSSRASRSRTNSFPWLSNFAAPAARLPASALEAASASRSASLMRLSILPVGSSSAPSVRCGGGRGWRRRRAAGRWRSPWPPRAATCRAPRGRTPGSRRSALPTRSSPKNCSPERASVSPSVYMRTRSPDSSGISRLMNVPFGSSISSGPVARSGRTSRSCHSHTVGWPADAHRRVCASVSNTTTQSEMSSSPASSADMRSFSSSRAWAGSRNCRRNTRSRYFACNAVIEGSMPWPVTSPMTAATRFGDDAEHVVEVAGHEAGARLVDLADLEPRDVGEHLRAPAGPPTAGARAGPG